MILFSYFFRPWYFYRGKIVIFVQINGEKYKLYKIKKPVIKYSEIRMQNVWKPRIVGGRKVCCSHFISGSTSLSPFMVESLTSWYMMEGSFLLPSHAQTTQKQMKNIISFYYRDSLSFPDFRRERNIYSRVLF